MSNVLLRYDDSSHGAVPYSITLRIRSLHLQNGDAPDAALAAQRPPALHFPTHCQPLPNPGSRN